MDKMVYGHVFPSSLLGMHCPLANGVIDGEQLAAVGSDGTIEMLLFLYYIMLMFR